MSQCSCNATYSGMENITIKETGKVKKVKDEEVNGQGGKRRERGAPGPRGASTLYINKVTLH